MLTCSLFVLDGWSVPCRSRDSLLNSKAQQDVLMRVISDPSTLEGQAAKRAFARIDQIAEDLRLPTNVVLMARQIAEVLLTMREESDQGAYFQVCSHCLSHTVMFNVCLAHGINHKIEFTQHVGLYEAIATHTSTGFFQTTIVASELSMPFGCSTRIILL